MDDATKPAFPKLTLREWHVIYFLTSQTFETPGGGTPHTKGVGMLVGNFELNP